VTHEYYGNVISVHDGDTYRIDVDLGFGVWLHSRQFRLAGVSCLETWMAGGPETTAYVGSIMRPGLLVYLRSTKAGRAVDPDTHMSFDRYVVDVTLPDGQDLATLLVRTGWAVWWDGRTKPAPYPEWPIPPSFPTE
jgi:endonuclease YncB( thermonuclease family)